MLLVRNGVQTLATSLEGGDEPGAALVQIKFGHGRRCLRDLDEGPILRHFNDDPIPRIRRDVIVDGNE